MIIFSMNEMKRIFFQSKMWFFTVAEFKRQLIHLRPMIRIERKTFFDVFDCTNSKTNEEKNVLNYEL